MHDIRRRIRTVQDMAEFTRSLFLVSAVRMQRARQAHQAAQPYLAKSGELSRHLMAEGAVQGRHPFLQSRPVYSVGTLVVTSDTGLCGPCNSGPVRLALALQRELAVPVRYTTVGRWGQRALPAAGVAVTRHFDAMPHGFTVQDITPVARAMMGDFLSGEVDAVVVVHNRFESVLSQVPEAVPLLPLRPEFMMGGGDGPEAGGGPGVAGYHYFEPAPEELLRRLLPQLVTAELYDMLLQARVSEHAARMRAMKAANDNALELHDTLLARYRRMRQTEVTSESRLVGASAEVLREDAERAASGAPVRRRSRLKPATVYSPVSLSGEQQARILQWVHDRFGGSVRFEWLLDRSLIGGIRIQVDGRVFDGSVIGRLSALRARAGGDGHTGAAETPALSARR